MSLLGYGFSIYDQKLNALGARLERVKAEV